MTDFPHLHEREGLPEALRVLADAFPRAGWEAHPNFGGLVRFWLERHLEFREVQGLMLRETRLFLGGGLDPEEWKPRLARLGSMFLQNLHGHHMIEDHEYFPMLARLEPRLEGGFGMLERDHGEIDALLAQFADAANAVLAGEAPREAAGAFEAVLGRVGHFLDRHLTDEEELVVPVVLKTGLG